MLFMSREGLFFITSAPQGFFLMFFYDFCTTGVSMRFSVVVFFLRGGRNTKVVPHKHHKLADTCYGWFLLLRAL